MYEILRTWWDWSHSLMSWDTRHMIKTDLTRHFPRHISEDEERLSGCLHLLLRGGPDSLLSTVILALFVSTFLAPHTVHHFHPFNPFSINGLNNYIFDAGFWHKCTQLESCFCMPPTPRPDSRQQLHNKTVCKIVRGQRAACSGLFLHHTSHRHQTSFPTINLQC